ncbi:hypothetical protein Scep_000684 [Stephania cephalantha]|uniref:Uncharacterized protein n=1 Tax=Stephania cephalantha TaxID=152367 RepID=A0AAP0L6K5_9MAGN
MAPEKALFGCGGRDAGVGDVGVTGLRSRDHARIIAARLYKEGRGARLEGDHARTEEREGEDQVTLIGGTQRKEVEAAEEGLSCGEQRRRVETKGRSRGGPRQR